MAKANLAALQTEVHERASRLITMRRSSKRVDRRVLAEIPVDGNTASAEPASQSTRRSAPDRISSDIACRVGRPGHTVEEEEAEEQRIRGVIKGLSGQAGRCAYARVEMVELSGINTTLQACMAAC